MSTPKIQKYPTRMGSESGNAMLIVQESTESFRGIGVVAQQLHWYVHSRENIQYDVAATGFYEIRSEVMLAQFDLPSDMKAWEESMRQTCKQGNWTFRKIWPVE